MKIELREISILDLVEGYHDDGDDGVVGYGGKLDIRPPYQRAFVYDDNQRKKVIDTVTQGFPLNVMYWSVRDDGTYEIIDGQQRTISIAQYVTRVFAFKGLYFQNLPKDKQEQILDYALQVYLCTGTDSERLDWFETINIAGVVQEKQELRNAVYAGPWVTDAKRYFSRPRQGADNLENSYLLGQVNRQKCLETVIKWASSRNDEEGIREYMGRHHKNKDAEPLWNYFLSVIEWIESTFTTYRKSMKGVDWGSLYNTYKDKRLDPVKIEAEVEKLLDDDEVQRESGIYPYILTGEQKHLNLRAFDARMKRRVYRKQDGICAICKNKFGLANMEADHITPWSEGGKTVEDNCQMLCRPCNREKAAK
ncbi:MAG: DUF262 domain-containing protein [Chloroflexi bacterium]|nr:DUF262 domain-containing protein [Chloroflexota bacterium]MCY3581978.1 DUF262 domain-containing protein [Chloroflexota bacterium]MCY3715052.1 DUF262 domain-containing protein [Chloroflexota bacterium]MDE2651560.1 DUF262 domain-containing protein [Chloroflexota bacterium]MXX50620.1 DUF262 domain-containing protein [Chloroflexota bacterium]